MCSHAGPCPKLEPVESLRPTQYRTLPFWACHLGVSVDTVARLFKGEARKVAGRRVLAKKYVQRRGLA